MREQTKMLCGSLPRLAQWFHDYDEKGHDWVIVTWRNIPPAKVTLDDVTLLPSVRIGTSAQTNMFTSRTSALRRSEESCRSMAGRDEGEHMGVWVWKDVNGRHYQSVLPVKALEYQTVHKVAQTAQSSSFWVKFKTWLTNVFSSLSPN